MELRNQHLFIKKKLFYNPIYLFGTTKNEIEFNFHLIFETDELH